MTSTMRDVNLHTRAVKTQRHRRKGTPERPIHRHGDVLECGPVKVSDATLDEVRERGYSLVEGFLSPDALKAAQDALWLHFPTPEEYFADPQQYAHFAASQFAGVEEFPYKSWDLNWLAVHPDLVEAAERYLGTAELHLYKVELWAKYAGAINYNQPLHRDYGSHSLVTPRPEQRYQQITTFIYLSDVTEDDGPTRIVSCPTSRAPTFRSLRCTSIAGPWPMSKSPWLGRRGAC
jgi:hypothetical protein